jgi:tetratricopeptide (TPR) repeat protein
MGDAWIQVLARDEQDRDILARDFRKKALLEDTVGLHGLVDGTPDNATLRTDLAATYLEVGRPHDAVGHLEAATRIDPRSLAAQVNLAIALSQLGRWTQAEQHYREALGIDDDSAAAHFGLGNVLDELNRPDEAIAHYREALRIAPTHAAAHNNLGVILMSRGQLDEASGHFEQTLRVDPTLADAHYNIGAIRRSRGARGEAVRHFRNALRYRPDWPLALADLAWILATAPDERFRDHQEALRLGTRAVMLTGRRDAASLDVLAAAYAANGDFEKAVETVGEAISVSASPALTERLLERRDLYINRRDYRETARQR